MRQSTNTALEETRLSNTTYLSGNNTRYDKSFERGKALLQNPKELKRKLRAFNESDGQVEQSDPN